MNEKPAILIIDDDIGVLNALRRVLRDPSYDVLIASTGAKALQEVSQERTAVVLCDKSMPGMDGVDTLAAVRDARPDIVRIMLTGRADLQDAQRLLNESLANYLLLKPWDDAQLRSTVAQALRSHALTKENDRLAAEVEAQRAELARWNEQLQAEVQDRTTDLEVQNAELRILEHRLRGSLNDVVDVLAAVLEALAPNSALHAKRVAQSAHMLGERLRLASEDLEALNMAARLHDLGEVIQTKRRRDTRTFGRTASMQESPLTYAETGYAVLQRVGGLDKVALAVRHQCERYDGSGGPEGRREEAIPIASRIIAVANAYDEAAHLHSRQAIVDRDAGRKALRDGAETAFDPMLVELFFGELATLGDSQHGDSEVELSVRDLAAGMVLSRSLYNHDGVLVLRSETTLTIEHVAHIQRLSFADPLLHSIYVKCEDNTSVMEAAQKKAPASHGGGLPNARGRVLVVDDDTLVSSALRRELRRAGWDVSCAADGRAAQNILEENTYDAIIIDVAMPVMRGDMLVAHVQMCHPECPCVVLTGHATREQLLRLSEAENVVAILAKPWDSARLADALEKATGRSPDASSATAASEASES